MKNQNERKASKKQIKGASVRITGEDAKLLKTIRARVNGKAGVRCVRAGEIVAVALRLIGDVQIREMQDQAVTATFRKDLLRQKYVAIHGSISAKEFDEFMMTSAYAEFLLAQTRLEAEAQVPA